MNNQNDTAAPQGHLGPNNSQTGPDYDPVNLMSQVFEDISMFLGPASDILLSWLLRLPSSTPAAEAAQKVLDKIVKGNSDGASEEGVKLIELLNQTATHSLKDIKLSGMDKRRGGRSARVKN
jgi:hypothetical protein